MIDLKVDLKQFERDINKTIKKQEQALSNALNWTAFDARDAIKDEMKSVFDNPTPWTLNSVYVKKAKINNHTVSIGIKDKPTKASVGAASYLRWQIHGGNRRHTRFERSLQASKILPRRFHAVIARGARRDRYGNIPNRRVRDVLSDVKSGRAGISSGSDGYFVMRGSKASRWMPLGIWQRTSKGDIEPVYTFTRKSLGYEDQLDFYGIIKKVRDEQFEGKYRRALRKELSK